MVFPEIDTDRLELTSLTEGDSESIFELFSNESVVEYYDLSILTNIEQANGLIRLFQQRYESESGIRWAIRLKEEHAVIGTCGFNSWSEKMRSAVIGYDLSPAFWREGYAYEATKAIIIAAFDGRLPCGPLHRIQADTVPGNYASEAL